jgi:hypothetical protein
MGVQKPQHLQLARAERLCERRRERGQSNYIQLTNAEDLVMYISPRTFAVTNVTLLPESNIWQREMLLKYHLYPRIESQGYREHQTDEATGRSDPHATHPP